MININIRKKYQINKITLDILIHITKANVIICNDANGEIILQNMLMIMIYLVVEL